MSWFDKMFLIHEKCAHSNATLFDNRQRQQKNREHREFENKAH